MKTHAPNLPPGHRPRCHPQPGAGTRIRLFVDTEFPVVLPPSLESRPRGDLPSCDKQVVSKEDVQRVSRTMHAHGVTRLTGISRDESVHLRWRQWPDMSASTVFCYGCQSRARLARLLLVKPWQATHKTCSTSDRLADSPHANSRPRRARHQVPNPALHA